MFYFIKLFQGIILKPCLIYCSLFINIIIVVPMNAQSDDNSEVFGYFVYWIS